MTIRHSADAWRIRPRRSPVRALLAIAASLALVASATREARAQPMLDTLSINVPGSPGGGFDRSAQAVRDALLFSGLVRSVELVHSPGAGGLVALAQFQAQGGAAGPTVMIGGRSILGATVLNRSRISLADVTPIARLNRICLVIAVGVRSPIRSVQDLLFAMRSDASLLKLVGGSPGSVDDQLLSALAVATGIDRQVIRFSAVPGGGRDVSSALAMSPNAVGISSFEEFIEPLQRGEIRGLARSCNEMEGGGEIPSLAEQGVAIDFTDWKGVFAPPGLATAERDQLIRLFEALSRSPQWTERLAANRWGNAFLSGEGFGRFVEEQQAAIRTSFVRAATAPATPHQLGNLITRPYKWAAGLALLAVLLLVAIVLQRRAASRNEEHLQSSLAKAMVESDFARQQLDSVMARSRGHIAEEFAKWKLSEAETEVGWLILKGLSFKEIGKMRSTSERTVRQQAQSIYVKSGLPSRADLSAYFLEDLRFDDQARQ